LLEKERGGAIISEARKGGGGKGEATPFSLGREKRGEVILRGWSFPLRVGVLRYSRKKGERHGFLLHIMMEWGKELYESFLLSLISRERKEREKESVWSGTNQ